MHLLVLVIILRKFDYFVPSVPITYNPLSNAYKCISNIPAFFALIYAFLTIQILHFSQPTKIWWRTFNYAIVEVNSKAALKKRNTFQRNRSASNGTSGGRGGEGRCTSAKNAILNENIPSETKTVTEAGENWSLTLKHNNVSEKSHWKRNTFLTSTTSATAATPPPTAMSASSKAKILLLQNI